MQHIAEILLGRALRRVEAGKKIEPEFHFSPLSAAHHNDPSRETTMKG
jgi:hypothetical protein